MRKYLICLALITTVCGIIDVIQDDGQSPKKCQDLKFLPMPQKITCNLDKAETKIGFTLKDPCKILYLLNSNQKILHVEELINHQQLKTFNCEISNIIFSERPQKTQFQGFQYTVHIQIVDFSLKSAFTKSQEHYHLAMNRSLSIIKTQTYVGFIRGLQTFLQSIQCPKIAKTCKMYGLPIQIDDQPAFVYRGLMVDTSRHFLPINLLYETIDAMMYNKLNVFHWHIVDEDAFPFILQSHPQIAEYGSFSPEQTYTAKEARDLVSYAMHRGVRVVPELDTPGHAASWGKAPQNNGVACSFGQGYMGPLDVTLDKTYTLLRQVFAQIMDIFPDPIIHLGGDEVVLACNKNLTDFLQKQKITQRLLERHYRKKQHKIIKQLNPNKKPMYWENQTPNVVEDDIVHWWGDSGYPNTQNPVVISNYGPFYLDMGVGNYYGFGYGTYVTWLDLYNQRLPQIIQSAQNKENALGAQVCLWSEVNNQYTHHMKIWIRSSAFAERVWNTQQFQVKPGFFRRITAHQRLMNRRGIPTAPATCQQCETHPQFC